MRRVAVEPLLLAASSLGLAVGGIATLLGNRDVAAVAWAATIVVGLAPAAAWVVAGLRRGAAGVDVIAVLALAGSLVVGELLAGALIALMLASGRELERRAEARAHRDLTLLLARAPRTAHRYTADGALRDVPVDDVVAGNRLLVRPGEVVPVDGVLTGPAVLDEAALTGEPLPVERAAGEGVRSGVLNGGGPVVVRATAAAAQSTFAGIVRLVEQASAETAPFVRLADRYAALFLPVTLVLAAGAWLASGDPVRAVAVLVVATPCPLLLAAPVAVVSGLSRAARRGVIVKGGAALEALAGGEVLLFDKTGTLTEGRPTVGEVAACEPWTAERVLALAAAVEQHSPHVLAAAIVRAASERGLSLAEPRGVVEHPGRGVEGDVEGHDVEVGKWGWLAPTVVPAWLRALRRRAEIEGTLFVLVRIDGVVAGGLLLHDPLRPDAPRMVRALRRAGLRRVVMVTGDRADVAEAVGAAIGVDDVLAERLPDEKLAVVRAEQRNGRVIMVGDGLNDAPALAAADVGVAIGARGATASSEAADVVLTVDRLDRLADVVRVARRSRRIAWQSVAIGMGLSLAAMGWAATGALAPAVGALLQEGIDVAAILNALRALGGGREAAPRLVGADAELVRRLRAEHRPLRDRVEQVRTVADQLDALDAADGAAAVRQIHAALVTELLPHELIEETRLYPALARVLGGDDPTGVMSRGHVEIEHLVCRLGRLLADLGDDEPNEDDRTELRRVLYGLYAVLRLHFAQEEEGFFTLLDDEEGLPAPRVRVAS